MTILVDQALWWHRDERWCHLASDESYDELHTFVDALGLGIPRRAFQGDHYDVPERLRQPVLDAGASEVGSRELLRRLKAADLRLSAAARRERKR